MLNVFFKVVGVVDGVCNGSMVFYWLVCFVSSVFIVNVIDVFFRFVCCKSGCVCVVFILVINGVKRLGFMWIG